MYSCFQSCTKLYPLSCLLDVVLYKLLEHALRYTASWAIMSSFWSFSCKKESSDTFAHLPTLWTSLKDCTRCSWPFWVIDNLLQKKKFDSSSLEDFDVWRKTKKTIESTFRIAWLTKKFYVNRKFRNLKKFLRTHSKMVDTAILQAKVQVFYPRKSIASHQSIASLITQQLPNFPQT